MSAALSGIDTEHASLFKGLSIHLHWHNVLFVFQGIYDIHIKLAGVPFLDWETPQMTSHIRMR